MSVIGAGSRFVTLAGLTARTTLSSRKGAVTWAVALLPLYVVGGLVASGQRLDVLLYQDLIVPLFLQVVLVVVTLVHGTRLLREEIEDRTLVYLTTRRLSKAGLVTHKFLGFYGSALVILLPPLAASYLLVLSSAGLDPGANLEVLVALLAMGSVGAAAFGGIFLLLGFGLRRPLAAGLLYGFLWESVGPNLPGDVPLLSVSHYLWSMGGNLVDVGLLGGYATGLGLVTAVLVPLLVALGTVFLTVVLILTTEVSTQE